MMHQVDFTAIVTHAYFYLIREREFAIRGEDVYKLGITKQVMGLKIPRFDGYKKGSELVMITECPMALLETIETSLKKIFCETFQRHGDGHEFFIGNRRDMSNLIYKACDDAWTEDQQRLRAETLRSVLQLQEAHHESGSMTVQSAQQKKACKAAEEAEKAAKEAEKAAEDSRRVTEEETNFTRWFNERVEIKADAFVKQASWYTDYRLWAVSADVVPIAEGTAIATFKRLYSSKGISVGNKTYGIELHAPTPTERAVPLEISFLADLAEKTDRDSFCLAGADLLTDFIAYVHELHGNADFECTSAAFGRAIQKVRGVIRDRKVRPTAYHLNKMKMLDGLIQLGFLSPGDSFSNLHG